MLHIESNTQQNIFYSAIKDKFLRITCSTLCLNGFIAKAKKLLESNKQKYSKFNATSSSLQKIILAHTESFQRFSLFSCFFLAQIFEISGQNPAVDLQLMICNFIFC